MTLAFTVPFNPTLAPSATNTALYNRAWSVKVGTADALPLPKSGIQSALNVSELDLEFEVVRSIKKVPNKCSLTIWNLTADHRAQILKRNQPNPASKQLLGVPVQIDAGYVGNTFTIFKGDLREVASVRTSTDWKTTLTGDDGGRAMRESRVNLQFTKGTPLSTVLQQIANALQVGLGNLNTVLGSVQIQSWGATLPHSFTFSGNASAALDRLLKSAALTWSIQDGALQILPIGNSVGRSAIVVSSNTGLLDSPEASIDSTVSLGNPQQFAAGAAQKVAKPPKPKDPSILKIKTLMIPGMVPGQLVQLQSQAFNGTYVISECRYIGRTWSPNDWCIESICRVSH